MDEIKSVLTGDDVDRFKSMMADRLNFQPYDVIRAIERAVREATTQAQPAPLNGIPKTDCHGEGAISRCSYCLRYSLDPATLSDRQPLCDCGKQHGWCGSFVRPDANSKWSGKAPSQPATQEQAK